jgi:hypothetical protein
MTPPHAVGSLLRFTGFLLLIAAVIPAARGEGLNVTRFVMAIFFVILGLIVGVKARGTK